MSDQYTKLEDLMTAVIENITEQVKKPDCPGPVLTAAIKLLKDQGVEVRRTKSNPLGNLAESLPTFPEDAEDGHNVSH